MTLYGYTGKILRVDLTHGKVSDEETTKELAEKYVGGSGFGIKYMYDEIAPGTEWNSPDNRLIFAAGPVGGTPVAGSAGTTIATKGPMTNMAVTSQAMGFFGTYLKFSGYDAIVVQGKSPDWVYLSIKDGKAELRDAKGLLGKDTIETEDALKEELGGKCTAMCIGPAGENLVRYAMVSSDKGHIASKNGVGAVMGSKKLKAIVANRGTFKVPVKDPDKLRKFRKELADKTKASNQARVLWGTQGAFDASRQKGALPVLNYTTCVYPEDPQINTKYIREHYEMKPTPCWACNMHHCHWVTVTEGPYKGQTGEEPEYESVAAWGPQTGNHDMGAVIMLADLTDRLGLDVNESGWTIGWVMECYEKGLLTRDQLDGLDMTWGNVEATREMLTKISKREGVGNLLAEGVKRASEEIGGEAVNMGVYTMKGAVPRGHDHRNRWFEMLDTCISSTSTLEATGGTVPTQVFGWPAVGNSYDPWVVSTSNAKINGWFVFLDSLVLCRFCADDPALTAEVVNAITGWNLDPDGILNTGKRIANQIRMFNLRHGLDISLEKPSPRYGSTPVDGPSKGVSIMANWKFIIENYYDVMGWDKKTGKPRADTLRNLGLDDLVQDLERI